ncbi:MAG: hypothetical protein RL307_761, partial [Pseudomonadota bacterium]
MLLAQRTAIITGAASPRGLGLATAKLFAEHGARVMITDLDATAAAQAIAALPGSGHLSARCNVTDKAECMASVQSALKVWGQVDILVNIAGITSPQRIMDVDPETYTRVMDINMRGTLYMTQAVVPHMRERRQGSIVNM